MVDTLEIINLIRKFKLALPNIAFSYNSPIKLYKLPGYEDKSLIGAMEKLEGYIKTSKDNQINFTDYNELQNFMGANSLLETACNLQTIEDIEDLNEKYRRMNNIKKVFFFYPHFKSIYDTWMSRYRYTTIPKAVSDQLIIKNKEYIDVYNAMGPKDQARFRPILEKMLDPTNLYNSLLKKYIALYSSMLTKWGNENRDKAQYLNHTYLTISQIKDIFSEDTAEAYLAINDWISTGFKSEYIINLNYLEQDLLTFANDQIKKINNEKIAKAKMEEQERKRKEEERKANPKEEEKRTKAIEEFENAYSRNSDYLMEMEAKAKKYYGVAEHLSTLPVEASEGQIDNLEKDLETLKKQAQDSLTQLNNISHDIE